MASIDTSVRIGLAPAKVWDAVSDVGAIHERLAPGVVVATEMLADAVVPTRRVTFAHGPVVDEVIVDIDDRRRRLVWSIRGGQVAHHNGAMQVHDDGAGGSQVSWIADVLPDALVDIFAPTMEAALRAMKQHLEREG